MEELLDWIMKNTNGSIVISKFRWGGLYHAYDIAFEAKTYNRKNILLYSKRYCSIACDMDLNTSAKKALDKLKSGYLNNMKGDIIKDKIGARYIDGGEFAELEFGVIVKPKK